jgi:hypothetical protein
MSRFGGEPNEMAKYTFMKEGFLCQKIDSVLFNFELFTSI